MIHISKTASIPNILNTKGVDETKILCDLYAANPTDYTSATGKNPKDIKRFTFEAAIYGHETVKSQLKTEQYHKCCFCESKFVHIAHGDVEHFRPKTAYKKEGERQYTYPGYYWLAYNWNNLFFSCQICNQSFKKNHFPLIDETKRVENHLQATNLAQETPYLIHFSEENPEDFIYFEIEIPKPKSNNIRGKKTISITGIDRKDLNDRRLEHLQNIQLWQKFLTIDINNLQKLQDAANLFQMTVENIQNIVRDAQNICKDAIKDEAEYAAMIRSNFPQLLNI